MEITVEKKRRKNKNVGMNIPAGTRGDELHDKLTSLARYQDRSLSNVLFRIVEEYFDDDGTPSATNGD